MINEHLDRITKLGFEVEISWNSNFVIQYYNSDIDLLILRAEFDPHHSFDEFMEMCIDMFYEWYNAHYKTLQLFELDDSDDLYDKLELSSLGSITTRVNRELNLDKLL